MKKSIFLLISFLGVFGFTQAMDTPPAIAATVKTYFAPEDKESINQELFALLDSATRQVLVAMYWITDSTIINKLIELKERNVDVQIIFDESSLTGLNILKTFFRHEILPLAFPSKTIPGLGIMHNKFLVVDNTIVWTGSANFTRTAIDPECTFCNNENIVILESENIAKKYTKAFKDLEMETFEAYISFITDNRTDLVPEWIKILSHTLYEENPDFNVLVNVLLQGFNQTQKNRLREVLPIQLPRRRGEPVTPRQQWFLESRGISTEYMTKQEAIKLIGEIKQSERRPYYRRR